MLLARPGIRQLREQGVHRRALVGKDPDVAVPAGEREYLGQPAEGAGVIAKPAEPQPLLSGRQRPAAAW